VTESRLARIESKIDELSEAVVLLARVEERMVTLFKRMDAMDAMMREQNSRVGELERVNIGRGVWARTFDKLAWLIIGAMVAAGSRMLGG